MRVTHVISGLGLGGAERMLEKLVAAMDDAWESEVVTLIEPGPMAEQIEAHGVRVRSLGLDRRFPNPLRVARLARWLDPSETDVVQTWMYHADLLGGIAGRLAGVPVVWGVRQSDPTPAEYSLRTRLTARACAHLSRPIPDCILVNSRAGLESHARIGYSREKLTVIPNGFDLETFKPREAARVSVREELGIPLDAPLVGHIARFHPVKDHRTLLEAAGRLHETMPEVHFLLCGDGVKPENQRLAEWSRAAGVVDHIHLLGRRADIPRLAAALDVATLTSRDEGFPNVVGEAMACGVPCVVTDVGDSAALVGETGRVVPPGAPGDVATAWESLLALDPPARRALGQRARERILEEYSIEAVADRYEAVYESLVGGR